MLIKNVQDVKSCRVPWQQWEGRGQSQREHCRNRNILCTWYFGTRKVTSFYNWRLRSSRCAISANITQAVQDRARIRTRVCSLPPNKRTKPVSITGGSLGRDVTRKK
jgi:hypothetical protein